MEARSPSALGPMTNPFPGLRAFEPDEDHMFFGRDRQTDELIRRLRNTRFLAVVGGSGSGKSSLVKSGLVPNLHRGYMAAAGSHWRVAILRPGENPLHNLAMALAVPELLGGAESDVQLPVRAMVEATLRSDSGGLANAVAQARLPEADNVLVVVDQFEELFRFQASRRNTAAREEALAFVKLLLAAASCSAVSIYVCLTMRSEYIGDCLDYPGLPEAVNAGQFLVPRMSRDELRAAVTGPVAVGGARIAPGLVTRIINDAGEAANQLPVLQHALMRTWDHWLARTQGESELGIDDYEAIGTMQEALSRHAEEAFSELSPGRERLLARSIFQALTETSDDERGVRRPTSVDELCLVCEASLSEVDSVIERFRRRGRTFLMPPPDVNLEPATVVDLSHEALMRIWNRLKEWAAQEKESAALYRRLAQSAALNAKAAEGLWRNPQLRLALDWRRQQKPNAVWAGRYGGDFGQAMAFLDRSFSIQRLRIAVLYGILAVVVLAILLGFAWRSRAVQEKARAEARQAQITARQAEDRARELQRQIDVFLEKNPQLAKEAVELRTRNRELSLRILEVATENRDLERRLSGLETERTALVAKRTQLKETITRLEKERAALSTTVNELKVKYAEQDGRERRVNEELQDLLGENGSLRASAIEKGYVVEAVERYARMSKAQPAPTVDVQSMAQLANDRLITATALPAKNNTLEQRLEQLRDENLRLKMTANELRQENSRLQEKLQPLEENSKRLKNDMDRLLKQNRALDAENSRLEKTRADLAVVLQRLQSDRTDLDVKIRAVNYSIYRLEGVIRQVREENDSLRRILLTPKQP